MEDVALIEGVDFQTVHDTICSLGVDKRTSRHKDCCYSTHMQNLLEWVISHQGYYKDKIDIIITNIESKIKKTGREPKGAFPQFLAGYILPNT